jgi:hypothetical protein
MGPIPDVGQHTDAVRAEFLPADGGAGDGADGGAGGGAEGGVAPRAAAGPAS